MERLVSRRNVLALAAAALSAVLIAVTVIAWPTRAATHPGGDPGGRIMAKIVPVVKVIPGFGSGRVPWIAMPCDSCNFPTSYAMKIEPAWDSCDGMAGTFGWDPVVIQVGFSWPGSSRALVEVVSKRMRLRGWARGAAPLWTDGGDYVWVSPRGHTPSAELELDRPSTAGTDQWMASVQAKPQGRMASGC